MDRDAVVLDNRGKQSNTFNAAGNGSEWHQLAPLARNRYAATFPDRYETWIRVTLRNVTVNQVRVSAVVIVRLCG